MLFKRLLVATFLATLSNGLPTLVTRQTLRESYDYVIVGGGTSGLVVGARLSENANTTVLVIEAGKIYDGTIEFENLLIPTRAAMVASSFPEAFWDLNALPIASLNNRQFFPRQAKLVGGGTGVNGMLFDRASKADLDDWARYIEDDAWNWDNMLPFFKKSESFTPPTPEQVRDFGITWDPNAHGTNGPVSAAFPPVIEPAAKVFHDAEKAAGIPEPLDGSNGLKVGTFWVTNSVKPGEWIRSYAKNSYHDKVKTRPNYHLLTETHVTKVNFDSNKNAVGVSYAASASSPVRSVRANKEVIVSAGGVHSAKILQLSGVGDKRLLQSLNIPVVEDLPGVGLNFQDHAGLSLSFRLVYDAPPIDRTNQEQLYRQNRTGPWTISVGNHLSYYSFPMLSPTNYKAQIAAARAADDTPYFPADIHPDFLRGYEVQKNILLDSYSTNTSGVSENVRTLVSVQRPFSRGWAKITSANPFERMTIDWRTLSHPMDLTVMTEGARQLRRTFSHPAFAGINQGELNPGPSVQTDAQFEQWIRRSAGSSFFHLSSTCSMGKREYAGVVDSRLRVYGVKRLRVIDSSIIPLTPGAHLSNTVYAIAERGAQFVKEGP